MRRSHRLLADGRYRVLMLKARMGARNQLGYLQDIGAVLTAIDDAMDNGTLSQRKALMQQLVTEIRVESRDAIFPTYRPPAPPVRVISGVEGCGGLEPAQLCVRQSPDGAM